MGSNDGGFSVADTTPTVAWVNAFDALSTQADEQTDEERMEDELQIDRPTEQADCVSKQGCPRALGDTAQMEYSMPEWIPSSFVEQFSEIPFDDFDHGFLITGIVMREVSLRQSRSLIRSRLAIRTMLDMCGCQYRYCRGHPLVWPNFPKRNVWKGLMANSTSRSRPCRSLSRTWRANVLHFL